MAVKIKRLKQLQAYWQQISFAVKSWSFDIDSQLDYVDMLNSYMASGEYKIKGAVQKVKESYWQIYGKGHIAVQISDRLIRSLDAGHSYVAVIRANFSANIAIGYELSHRAGSNNQAITEISNLVRLEREIRKNAFSTLLTPGLMALLAVVTVAAIGKFMIPALEAAKVGVIRDSIERTLSLTLGNLIFDWWPVLLVVVVALGLSYRYLQQNLLGATRVKLDNLWPFSNYRVIWSIRLMKLLGLLKRSGMRDIEALRLIRQYGSPYVIAHIDSMIYAAKSGQAKQQFGVDLLSKIQQVRLSSSRTLSDDKFTAALLNTAEQSSKDVKLLNQRAIKAFSMLLYLIFVLCGGLGFGAIFKSGMSMTGTL